MKPKVLFVVIVIIALIGVFLSRLGPFYISQKSAVEAAELTVAISPYQDLAMLVNAEPLGFAKKYGLKLRLVTMPWEDILTAVSSAGKTVDVGFGSLTEYLAKYAKLNEGSSDPILFVQPLYVYKGGGFITFDSKIEAFDAEKLKDTNAVAHLLRKRIGAQKQSIYEMMIFAIARRANVPTSSLNLYDMQMNDGLLALQSGNLDISSAGLTQVNEAQKRGGRIVLSMEDAGFADVTGFLVRKSILEAKRSEIESLIRVWFDCVNYVMTDLKINSKHSLDYLRRNAATQYTFEEYSNALSQEYLPRSLGELKTGMLSPGAKYEFERLNREIMNYLIDSNVITNRFPIPKPLLSEI